jgi:hypothetical protein
MSQNAAPKTLRILAFIANGDVDPRCVLACLLRIASTDPPARRLWPCHAAPDSLGETSCSPLPKLQGITIDKVDYRFAKERHRSELGYLSLHSDHRETVASASTDCVPTVVIPSVILRVFCLRRTASAR